jgi:hypothetical protein
MCLLVILGIWPDVRKHSQSQIPHGFVDVELILLIVLHNGLKCEYELCSDNLMNMFFEETCVFIESLSLSEHYKNEFIYGFEFSDSAIT